MFLFFTTIRISLMIFCSGLVIDCLRIFLFSRDLTGDQQQVDIYTSISPVALNDFLVTVRYFATPSKKAVASFFQSSYYRKLVTNDVSVNLKKYNLNNSLVNINEN